MLAAILARIRSASDTAALFTALGYRAVEESIGPGPRVVARWRGFSVMATDAEAPREAARALARRLATTGDRALAAAVGSGEIALAAPRIGTSTCTRILTLRLDAPSPVALAQLASLHTGRGTNAIAHALRIADALSTEAVSERFFTEFRVTFERMAGSSKEGRGHADRRMTALLALTRVLFLYFIQAKGWLDGRPDYLRELLDRSLARGEPFHRSTLEPLFFGTLNRPVGERTPIADLGQVPYLNGGLFEPHPAERRAGFVAFANDLWCDAFERLFDRFRFCVREADEVDAIAPDMLGRVFERLMEDDERHRSGSFYTPEQVVRDIVETALCTALGDIGSLPPDAVRCVLHGGSVGSSERTTLQAAMGGLRILDPAVGSGAFLLGALETLTDLATLLEPPRSASHRRQIRHQILRESLFGVDVNPMAVRLAELRLWLTVVADDPTTDIASVAPLPNLDAVVRQGNSLLDPLGAARALHSTVAAGDRNAIRVLQGARQRVFEGRGKDARQAIRDLQQAEHRLADRSVAAATVAAESELRELRSVARTRDLFGTVTGLTATQRLRCRMLARNLTALRRATAALVDGALPFFSFEVHAADVMARGGFDVVLGNPPWVRAERLPPHDRRILRQRFRLWRGGSERGFKHLPDLAVAFLERTLELAAPEGTVALLMPSKLATAGYGEAARRHLVRETTIRYLHRISDRDAARFGATTYPLAVVLRKSPPPPGHMTRLAFAGAEELPQASLVKSGPWILIPHRTRAALEQFRRSGRPLGDAVAVGLGLKTGADRVLVGIPIEYGPRHARVRFGGAAVDIESEVLRPVVRGRDIGAFSAHAGRVLLWGYERHGQARRHLPACATRYLEAHAASLRRRTDYRTGPLWTLFRTGPACSPHRVVWPDIARHPRAVVLDETAARAALPLNTCYVAPAPSREFALLVAGLINSTWCAAFVSATADEARGGYRRNNARTMAGLPLPTVPAACAAVAAVSRAAHEKPGANRIELDEVVACALELPSWVQEQLRTLAARHG